MDLEGKRIKHNILKKEGTIIKCSEKYITVKLDNDLHEMQFQYPNCFLKYLSILDNQVSIEIKKAQKAREKKDKEEAEKTEQLKRKRDKYYTLKTDVHKPKTKTDYLQQYSSVNDFCESFEKEIDLEIQELRNTGAKRYQGYNIVKIDFNDSNYIYSFETDIEHFLPNGTQIKIHYYGKSQPATIISCEEYSIIISTNTFLAANIDMIEFSAEPWFLLLSLNERLDDLMNSPSLIAKDLISYASKEISPKEKILKGQNEACELSTKQPITFIWGPPGTGKTHTLARIVLNNLIQNNKVLMLSHSNVSVDGAMLRVYKLAPEIEPGKIIRYGYPRQAELLDHPYLTSFKYALYKKPHLQNKRDKLYAEKKKLKDVIKEQRKLLQPFLDRPDWIELDAEQKKLLKMYEKLSNTLSLIKKQDQIINSLGPKKTQEMLEDESTILKAFFAAKEYVEKEIHDQEALTADINEKVLKNTITEVRSELKLLQNQYIELRELIKKEQRQIQLSNASKDEDLRKILEKRLEEEGMLLEQKEQK